VTLPELYGLPTRTGASVRQPDRRRQFAEPALRPSRVSEELALELGYRLWQLRQWGDLVQVGHHLRSIERHLEARTECTCDVLRVLLGDAREMTGGNEPDVELTLL